MNRLEKLRDLKIEWNFKKRIVKREIVSVLMMDLPKDCKQIIIEKIIKQYHQEDFYLFYLSIDIESEYLQEAKDLFEAEYDRLVEMYEEFDLLDD